MHITCFDAHVADAMLPTTSREPALNSSSTQRSTQPPRSYFARHSVVDMLLMLCWAVLGEAAPFCLESDAPFWLGSGAKLEVSACMASRLTLTEKLHLAGCAAPAWLRLQAGQH